VRPGGDTGDVRFSIFVFATTAAFGLAACSGGGGGSPAPVSSAAPTAAFVPASVTIHSSAYDYYGNLNFSAVANAVPKPISPADGSLACTGGIEVPLDIRSGPVQLDLVRDQFVVLPLRAQLPQGTTLACKSTWGIYQGSTLLASTTLQATIVYDTGAPAISFTPSTVTLQASGAGNPTIVLAYVDQSGFSLAPVAPASGYLDCGNGYLVVTKLHAGAGVPGFVQDDVSVDMTSISPPAGSTLTCTSTWALDETGGSAVQTATLNATLQY
jgi:hypothetical protein